MRKILITELHKIAKIRPPGYMEDCMAHGRIEGDYLVIEDPEYYELLKKYRGLGDAVATVAKPIARLIDDALGTDLQNCGGCAERQDFLNKAVPFDGK